MLSGRPMRAGARRRRGSSESRRRRSAGGLLFRTRRRIAARYIAQPRGTNLLLHLPKFCVGIGEKCRILT
jgi:hypothetical protein